MMSKSVVYILVLLMTLSMFLAIMQFRCGSNTVGVYWLLVAIVHFGNIMKGSVIDEND